MMLHKQGVDWLQWMGLQEKVDDEDIKSTSAK